MGFGALIIPGLAMIGVGLLGTRKSILQRAFDEADPVGRNSPAGRYVKINGVVKALDSAVVREPLFNQPCAWFSIKAEKKAIVPYSYPPFHTLGFKRSVTPLLIVNEAGTFLIDPAKARMYVPYKDEQWEGRRRARMARLSAGDRVIAIGNVQKLEPAMGDPILELARTPRAPLIVTTFTEGELQRHIAKQRVWWATSVVVGVGLSLVALFA